MPQLSNLNLLDISDNARGWEVQQSWGLVSAYSWLHMTECLQKGQPLGCVFKPLYQNTNPMRLISS